MSAPAVVFDGVSKKFVKGERFNSLRDLIPAMTAALMRRGPRADSLDAREFWALKDVSFEVRPGEALGIIGPNGAGKSTALKILTRILRPDIGRAAVRGRVGALVEIAAGFHPDLTGRENVYMQGAIMGMKRAEIARKFDEIVDFAGVAEFIDTPIKRYSSGMNARLGFAVAAHLDPDVLLIDEVLSVGDLSFQEKCFARMQQFARSGIAIVFISHNLSAISMLCTRVLVLRQGQVQALAPTHDALTVYAAMAQQASGANAGRELVIQVLDRDRRPVSEVTAGAPLHVRCRAHGDPGAGPLSIELLVRHLETGSYVYRCQSHNAGADPITLKAGETLEMEWSLTANLGRGHYAVSAALLNEGRSWLAVSNPALLTVNERESEQAVVFLSPTCSARAVPPAIESAVAIG